MRKQSPPPVTPVPWRQWLRAYRACRSGRAFATNYRTFKEAWQACETLPWMFWLVNRSYRNGTPRGLRDQEQILYDAVVFHHRTPQFAAREYRHLVNYARLACRLRQRGMQV